MAQPQAMLHSVLLDFPAVDYAFAYGSGVFTQPGLYDAPGGGGAARDNSGSDRPMLDFIFAVEDPVAWHEENLRRHPHHYSFLRWLGPSALTSVAERLGAGVYFNTLVPWQPHQLIKYGVVRLAALQHDLLHWSTLYCAGRLHKPVATLRQHAGVAESQEHNLAAALRVALLLLPPRFNTRDLLHAICALSYSGDVRMGLAEDSSKVHRIVSGSLAGLQALYTPPMAAAQDQWRVLQPAGGQGGDTWLCDDSPAAAAQLATALPSHVLERVARRLGLPLPSLAASLQQKQQGAQAGDQQAREHLQAVGQALASKGLAQRQKLLRHAVHAIVGASSRRQAVSGLLTAGLAKSARYGWAKLRKAWR